MSIYSLIKGFIPLKNILGVLLAGCFLLNSQRIEALSIAPCPDDATVVKYDYLGACGLTKTSAFTLNTAVDVSRIRIWYNTNIGADPLNVNIIGPNGYSWSGASVKGGCDTFQKNWCEGIVHLNQRLPAGTYSVDIGSTSMCSNPSGLTTLLVYGCEAVLFPPDNFRYTLTGDQLAFQWGTSTGADGYRILWGTDSGNYSATADLGNITQLGPFSVGNFPKVSFYVAVEAYNNSGKSIPSNELAVNLGNVASLSAPQQLRYGLTGDMFTLNWNSVANSAGYNLYLGSRPGQYSAGFDLGNNLQLGPMNVSGLPEGNYYLAVTAYAAQKESPYSNEVLVTLKTTGGTGGADVGGYIDSVMGLSNDLLSGGINEQLQPILSAIFGKPGSTCPTVTMNADLSTASDINTLLKNLPKPFIINVDYGQGCKAENGDTLSGSAEVKVDNLAIDSVSNTLTTTLSIVSNNLTKNGKVIGDGSVGGNVNANLGNSTGNGHFELTNFLVSTGTRITGNVNFSILDKTNTTADIDIFSSDNIHAKMSLLATKINDKSYSFSTQSPGTINQYTVTFNSVVYDTAVCKNYPIAGTGVFTADGKTQTVTFNNRCDGTYSIQ